jgi:RNA polymerase sigma-70 factor (ECF subfamily)
MTREQPGSRLDRDHERALVARARADAAAFGELYDFYLPRIHGFIVRRVGDRAVAEDLTAVTFERALNAVRRDDFRNDAFGAWLFRVASNAIVDHVRGASRTIPLAADGEPEPIGDERAARQLEAAVERDQLRRAMSRLSEQHRRALALRFVDDLDAEEAAAVMGCSRATFAVRLHRALNAMRGALAEEATDAA